MKSAVSIPTDYFLKEVKQEYSIELNLMLTRELNQNSFDANATRIDYEFSLENRRLKITDTGHGMTKESLIKGLLTFGGSIKKAGDRGGFGAFKKVLFGQDKYLVRTQNHFVAGEGIEYDLQDSPFFNGTELTIFFPASWPNLEGLPDAIKKVASMSNICPVYLDGQLLKQATPGVTPLETEFATIRELPEKQIVIRFGGLYMFQQSAPGAKGYTYDVKGVSKETLNQSRERFRYDSPHYEAFNAFIKSLSVNSEQGLSAQMSVARAPKDKVFNGVKYRGNAPDKMLKEHKTLFCLAAAISHTMGVRLNKDNLGFFFDDDMRGMCEGGRNIYLNPDALITKEWNAKSISGVIRTVLHELSHSSLLGGSSISYHEESFALRLQEVWREFWLRCNGIAPLMELARRYRKLHFPITEKPQLRKVVYTPKAVNPYLDSGESWD